MLASGAVSASGGKSTPVAGWNAWGVPASAETRVRDWQQSKPPLDASPRRLCATHLPNLDQRLRAVALQEVQLASVDADDSQQQLAREAQRQGNFLVVERLVDDCVCTARSVSDSATGTSFAQSYAPHDSAKSVSAIWLFRSLLAFTLCAAIQIVPSGPCFAKMN